MHTAAAQNHKKPRNKLTRMQRNEEIAGYLFLLPNLIGVIIFVMFPIFASLLLSFTKWSPVKGLAGMEFVGLDNFVKMMGDSRVHVSLINNFVYSIAYVPISIFLALVLAAVLNNYVLAKVPIRLMCFMPYISSIVSVAVVWMVLLYPQGGPVNAVLTNVFGVQNPPGWFTSSQYALAGITMMSIWHDAGYYMIILLAGMQNIPQDMYEAADIDGANTLRKFFRITVPMLSSTLFFVTILATIASFKVFDAINIITRGGPGRSTNVLVYAIYYYAFKEHNIGYASAIALLLFAIIFVLSFIQMKLKKKFVV